MANKRANWNYGENQNTGDLFGKKRLQNDGNLTSKMLTSNWCKQIISKFTIDSKKLCPWASQSTVWTLFPQMNVDHSVTLKIHQTYGEVFKMQTLDPPSNPLGMEPGFVHHQYEVMASIGWGDFSNLPKMLRLDPLGWFGRVRSPLPNHRPKKHVECNCTWWSLYSGIWVVSQLKWPPDSGTRVRNFLLAFWLFHLLYV